MAARFAPHRRGGLQIELAGQKDNVPPQEPGSFSTFTRGAKALRGSIRRPMDRPS